MQISKQALNAISIILGIAILALLALIAYNYTQTHVLNYSSLISAGLCLLILIIARSSLAKSK